MSTVEPAERQALVVTNMALVIFIAESMKEVSRTNHVDWDDLVSEGNLALVEASQRWDPERCRGKFAIFAGTVVRRALKRAARGKRFPQTGLNLDRRVAIRRPPTLLPLFPITAYDPLSVCPHRNPIEKGSVFCCMICHCSGQDHHPAMQIGPGDVRRAEKPIPKTDLAVAEPKRETRKQRRAREFGHLLRAASA